MRPRRGRAASRCTLPAVACAVALAMASGAPARAVEPATGLALVDTLALSPADTGRPVAITVSALGRVVLADPGRGTLLRLGPDGATLYEFEVPPGQPSLQPLDAEATGFKVYVLDAVSGTLLRYGDAGSFLDVLHSFGTGGGEVPRAVAVDGTGRVLLALTPLHAVRLLDERNRTETMLGGFGNGPGEMTRPTSVAFAPDGSFYVADTGNTRIQRFSSVGNFETAFGDSLGEPRGLAVGASGEVYVADPARRAVHLFGPRGGYRAALRLPAHLPLDVAVQGDTLWVLSSSPPAVLRARVLRGG